MVSHKEVEALLEKLDASDDTELRYREGSKHGLVTYRYRGKLAGKLGFSRSQRKKKSFDYSNYTQQMHLETKQFKQFADCTMSVADYEQLIRKKGVV